MKIPKDWEKVKDKINNKDTVFVLGELDSGKTTLVHYLRKENGGNIVDTDVGQSDIGPPTVIGRSRDGEKLDDGYFVGSISPRKHFTQMIVGTKKMVERSGTPVFVDTTGMVKKDASRDLKTQKIEAINPDKLIIIGNNGLNYYNNFKDINTKIFNVDVPKDIRSKTRDERKNNRESQFSEYFSNTKGIKVDLEDDVNTLRSLLGSGTRITGEVNEKIDSKVYRAEALGDTALIISDQKEISKFEYEFLRSRFDVEEVNCVRTDQLKNLLIGLLNCKEEFLGIGILEKIKPQNLESKVRVPKGMQEDPHTVKFGSFRVNAFGEEQGFISF